MLNDVALQQIRGDFPGLKTTLDGMPITYLDNAATTLKPQCMIDAINEYYGGISSNVHRGKNFSLEAVSNRYEQARYKVAELLCCSGNEIVFTRNTTESLNLVANGLGLNKSDLVVVFSDAHHSNFLPWMENADVRVVRTNSYGMIDMVHYAELLKLSPKVVAIVHSSNVTGIYCPLAEMASAAKQAGAIVVVDAAQSVPHRRINVKALDIDFLTFSAHKMAGPTGLGVLYGTSTALEQLKPSLLGGGMVDWVESSSYRLRKIPHRLEAGTPHIAGAYGIAASIDYLNKIGFDLLEEHDSYMGKLLLESASKRDYLEVIGADPNADRGAVLSFKIPAASNLDDIARVLSDSYGIMCRNGHLCAQPYVTEQAGSQVLRVSAYIYNTPDEVTRFFDALDEVSQYMFY